MTLCETFRELSFSTWTHLGRARRIGHQPLEETLTDINMLELKDRHADEVFTRTFTRPQEGVNGADWEWWFTDDSMTKWLGIRVQAKILKLSSNRFEHLHYRKGKTYQAAKLKRVAAKDGLVPMYCVFTHWSNGHLRNWWPCGTFGPAMENFGCSMLATKHVDALRRNSHEDSLAPVMECAVPWHCLVCCAGYGGSDLPERVWSFLQKGLGIKPSGRKPKEAPQIGIRERPPNYVRMVIESERGKDFDGPDKDLRGIVVFRDRKR